MDKKMEKEISTGVMEVVIKESSKKTIRKVKA